jgi:hypothetical protein
MNRKGPKTADDFKDSLEFQRDLAKMLKGELWAMQSKIDKLQSQLSVAVAALEFYAEQEFYIRKGELMGGTGPEARGATWWEKPSHVDVDFGKRARAALEKLK